MLIQMTQMNKDKWVTWQKIYQKTPNYLSDSYTQFQVIEPLWWRKFRKEMKWDSTCLC